MPLYYKNPHQKEIDGPLIFSPTIITKSNKKNTFNKSMPYQGMKQTINPEEILHLARIGEIGTIDSYKGQPLIVNPLNDRPISIQYDPHTDSFFATIGSRNIYLTDKQASRLIRDLTKYLDQITKI
uniref:Uncharacterized protein n=1 Tax=Thermoplasma acidophilum TaxID=2303 RepID=Q0KKX8_THEAI|nr:hypothetical protein [Cloning vector pSTA]BAF30832.1 hypothetical protein [Thermoplasma acidophilum]